MGDKIGVLNHGRLVQTGTPHEIYNNPRDTFVASFVGSPPMNLIDGRLVAGRAVMAPLNFELPFAGVPGGAATDGRPLVFGIRPEDVYLESGAPVEARVHDVENHGVEKILTLRVGDTMLRATVPARTDVAIEQPVRFAWNPDKVVLFDKGSGVSLRHAGTGGPIRSAGFRPVPRPGNGWAPSPMTRLKARLKDASEFVAQASRDHRDPQPVADQPLPRLVHPHLRDISRRRLADDRREALGEARARGAHDPGQRLHRPVAVRGRDGSRRARGRSADP